MIPMTHVFPSLTCPGYRCDTPSPPAGVSNAEARQYCSVYSGLHTWNWFVTAGQSRCRRVSKHDQLHRLLPKSRSGGGTMGDSCAILVRTKASFYSPWKRGPWQVTDWI